MLFPMVGPCEAFQGNIVLLHIIILITYHKKSKVELYYVVSILGKWFYCLHIASTKALILVFSRIFPMFIDVPCHLHLSPYIV